MAVGVGGGMAEVTQNEAGSAVVLTGNAAAWQPLSVASGGGKIDVPRAGALVVAAVGGGAAGNQADVEGGNGWTARAQTSFSEGAESAAG